MSVTPRLLIPGDVHLDTQVVLGAGTAEDYTCLAGYYHYVVVSDEANTTTVHSRANAAAGGSDPTTFTVGADSTGMGGIEIGSQVEFVCPRAGTVLRFKSTAAAVIRIYPYQPSNQ